MPGEDEDEDEATVMLNGDSDDEDAEWEMPGHDGLHAKEVRCHIAPPAIDRQCSPARSSVFNVRLRALPCRRGTKRRELALATRCRKGHKNASLLSQRVACGWEYLHAHL